MSKTKPATESTATDTTIAAPVAAIVVPKAPSKKSLAVAIFAAKMVERDQKLFASNKEFRAAVLTAIQKDLGVSTASAATMYNACKAEAEKAGLVTLGRDPKKEKVAGTGKRGRPSKKVAPTDAPAVTAGDAAVAEPVVADVTV